MNTAGGTCRRGQCPTCNRPTYKGCGNHIEPGLDDVLSSERCQCAEKSRRAKAARPKRSWFGARSNGAKQSPRYGVDERCPR